jgi:PAS domain S-box-containing protein
MRHLLADRAIRITILYLVLATVWFFVVDQVMALLSRDPQHLVWLETYNAWLFVAVTAILLYFERRRADRQSRHLAAVVASTEDAIVGATPDGTITAWNYGAERLYGYSSKEALGQSISILFGSEDSETLETTLNTLRQGTSIQRDAWVSERGGPRKRWRSLRMFPIRDEGGRLTGISATVRDITWRKEYEETLSHQAQIIDQIHDAVVSTDLQGHVTGWNRGAERLYGYTEEEALGRHIEFLYPPEEHQFLRDEIIGPLLRAGDHGIEVRMRKKSGEHFYAHLSLSLLRDPAGKPERMIGYAIDITKRKRAESALRMARVGELASGLVHEVRNPLNAMQIQMAIMHDGLKEPDAGGIELATSQLKCLEQEVIRVQELANDFLAYGRPSPDNPEPIDLGEAIQSVASFVKPEFDQIGASVVISGVDQAGLVVNTDPAKLRQVLLNLAVNAKQAMGEGGRLTLEAGKASEGEAYIVVQDTGCGIPSEKLPRIFEAFYSTRDEGTGLGLAIVKQTIEGAGGRILVESEVGVGTRFQVYLPLAAGASSPANKAGSAIDAAPMER